MIPTTPTTVRIQPVQPERPSSEDIGRDLAGAIGLFLMYVPLSALFLMLAFGTLHELWPQIPSVGFWQAITLVLGLGAVLGRFGKSWKWARR